LARAQETVLLECKAEEGTAVAIAIVEVAPAFSDSDPICLPAQTLLIIVYV